jgi:hypothetical protein
MLAGAFEGLADIKQKENVTNQASSNEEIKEIRVAIYTNEIGERYYLDPLENYSWRVGNTLYNLVPTILSTKDIIKGKLTIEDYDVFVYSFNQADQYLFRTSFPNLPRNIIIKRNIVNFVKAGGGYYGSCGGAAIAGGMKNKPRSFLERAMYKSQLGISVVEFEYDTAVPLLADLINRKPEAVDTQSYLLYSGWFVSNPHDMNYSAICPEINISKDNAIFDDFIGDTRKIRWIGMSPFELPENPDREITVLAKFPEEELSDNVTNQIHYWTYEGKFKDLLKGLFTKGDINWCKNFGLLMRSFLFSTDWVKTDILVKTNVSNKIFMSAEVYPNENKARIVRCSGHPDLTVWWGGHLEDIADTDKNNLYDGFYRLQDAVPFNETVEDEERYNDCIIRRAIAWEAKIPDSDLPTVYGASEVVDISPNIQSSPLIILGNSKEERFRKSTLDLYYRYSDDNSTNWSNWVLYETDSDGSNGWSWEFASPNGTGYYQFYSVRRVDYEGYTEIETAPPGPDAIVYIN